jgi:ankyrin repeat protein
LEAATIVCGHEDLWKDTVSDLSQNDTYDDVLGAGLNLLHIAASLDNGAAAAFLIERGIDVNTRNDECLTPLHDAARFASNVGILRFLIEMGAGIDLECSGEWTPLDAAVFLNPNIVITKFLIAAGANPSTKEILDRVHSLDVEKRNILESALKASNRFGDQGIK